MPFDDKQFDYIVVGAGSSGGQIADELATRPEGTVPLELLHTLAYVTAVAPSFSLRGGTREILRGMIARGLGLR